MSLLSVFFPLWENYYRHHTLNGELRKHPCYQEDPRMSIQGSAAKLYFILLYFKENPNQEYHGELFSMSQSKVSLWIKLLARLLSKALAHLKHLPKQHGEELVRTLQTVASVVFWIDGTEHPIPRSVDYERQNFEHSGKKGRHTIKNQILSDLDGNIIFISDTYSGSIHDKVIADEQELKFPDDSTILLDLGYLGYQPENVAIVMPFRKPRGKELSNFQKQINQQIASLRVKVEHVIGGMKRLKIVREKIRVRGDDKRHRFCVIAVGLHNLRNKHRKNS